MHNFDCQCVFICNLGTDDGSFEHFSGLKLQNHEGCNLLSTLQWIRIFQLESKLSSTVKQRGFRSKISQLRWKDFRARVLFEAPDSLVEVWQGYLGHSDAIRSL